MKKKKVIDMGKNTQFIPEIWSEYILDKFRHALQGFKWPFSVHEEFI